MEGIRDGSDAAGADTRHRGAQYRTAATTGREGRSGAVVGLACPSTGARPGCAALTARHNPGGYLPGNGGRSCATAGRHRPGRRTHRGGLTGGSRSSSCRTGCTAAARPPFRPPPRGRRTSSRSTPCARRAPTGAARPLEQRRAVLEELFREHWPTAPWALCPRRPPSTAPGTLHGSCRSSASDRAQQCKLDHQIPLKSRSADGPCRVRVLYPCVRSPSRMSASMWGARSSGLDAARHSAPVSWRKSPGSASGRMLPSFLPASRSWVIAAMTGP